MIGDGQWITVAPIGEHELSLVVSTPQRVRVDALRDRCALGASARSPGSGYQSMTIEDGVNGAARWNLHLARQSSKEALPDLAGAPVWFLALGGYDGRFDLLGQLVGIVVGAPGPIREPLQPTFLITLEDLVAGLARDLKLAAQGRHALAVFEPNHESYTFVHNRTFLPWHPTPAPFQGKKCNPCLRYVLLPMCRAAHVSLPVPNDPKADIYDKLETRTAFVRETVRRLRAVPGVENAALSSAVPLQGALKQNGYRVEGTPESGDAPTAVPASVTPEFFRTIGAPLVRGRVIQDTDDKQAPLVVLVDEAAARHFWGAQDPIGKRIRSTRTTRKGIVQPG